MVKKKIIKKIVTKLKDYKKKIEEKKDNKEWNNVRKKIPKSEFVRRREEFLVPSPKKTKVPSLDEHKRKKYKPFTKEHLATFHKLENRSDILKPKKIKKKKGEINIIALPPKKKKTGGVIKKVKYKEPVEIKKVRQAVKKVKSKKGIKKKAVTAATEAVKFTKWPERLSTKEPSKKGYWVDPQGGGLYHGSTSVRRTGRKTTFKSGKFSVSKKGNEYEALYGRTKFQQRPGYKSIGRGGKDWSAELYGTNGNSGFRFKRTWRFKEGGVVPNKKGEFIAIGCGKVMGNRRKTTKIR